MADLSVFGKFRTKQDFDMAAEEFALNKQLKQAQVGELIKKQNEFDVRKVGEQAFIKAAQGIELTPTELAAARYLDAKSGGVQFDPVTGNRMEKPRLSDTIPLGGQMGAPSAGSMRPDIAAMAQGIPQVDLNATAPQASGKLQAMPAQLPLDNMEAPKNQFDLAYEEQIAANANNPKLQNQLKLQYAKEKTKYNQDQAKNAGFADRMRGAEAILSSPESAVAGTNLIDRLAGGVPVLGNYVTSTNYKKFDQAKRDFINAVLRRESGAAIAASEFENADQQYFPQPNDPPELIAQKAENRQRALSGVATSAGVAYNPTTQAKAQPKVNPSNIPMGAAKYLKANPQAAADFDAKYGAGASKMVLGK